MSPFRLLCCLILAWLCMALTALALLSRLESKPQRHQWAFCFSVKAQLSYPCHENPYWSADL